MQTRPEPKLKVTGHVDEVTSRNVVSILIEYEGIEVMLPVNGMTAEKARHLAQSFLDALAA